MKILYLTHGTINFEEKKAFYDTLVDMGHEAHYANYNDPHIYETNIDDAIVKVCEQIKPDLVFFIPNQDQVEFRTLRKMQDMNVPILAWFCDDAWRFDDYTKYFLPFIDYAVTTDPYSVPKYYKNSFENVILLNWAANPKHYIKMDCDKIYDVSFVGQNHGIRGEIIDQLKQAGINIHAFGKGFTERISFDDMIKIWNQSKINLNFGAISGKSGRIQAKARDFEIACTGGGALLTQRNPLLEKYFNNKEIVQWDNIEHLIDCIKFLLEKDSIRENYSKLARKRVLREHTYQHRFTEIFKYLTFLKGENNGHERT